MTGKAVYPTVSKLLSALSLGRDKRTPVQGIWHLGGKGLKNIKLEKGEDDTSCSQKTTFDANTLPSH